MVLVVDDQPEYARLISLSLEREGFEVRTASGGDEALDMSSELHPDVVLLDIHMPGRDGFEVMAELREQWRVPIIMVTGDDQLEQRTSGLDRGADDYVTKPFSARELVARVRALVRRTGGASTSSGAGGDRSGPQMSRRASRILRLLEKNPGKVLYHDELLAHAFGPAFVGDIALLHEEMRRLRRSLGVRAGMGGPIQSVKGVGYRFVAGKSRPDSGRRPTSRAHRAAVGS